MRPTTLSEAFSVLDHTADRGIPFDAIRILYEHDPHPAILEKVVFTLTHAYDEDLHHVPGRGFHPDAALWYAIVAEHHMDERLVQPIIQLYSVMKDWDLLSQQGQYLTGLACAKLGEPATMAFFDEIDRRTLAGSALPYLYLHDSLFYVDHDVVSQRVLQWFHQEEEPHWLEALISVCGCAHFTFLLPAFHKMLDEREIAPSGTPREKHTIQELQNAIELLERDTPSDDPMHGTYVDYRGPWEAYYQKHDSFFQPIGLQAMAPTAQKAPKVGRNAPCPCGSGKKYKRCCWPN